MCSGLMGSTFFLMGPNRRLFAMTVSVKDMIRNEYKEKPIMGVWSMKRKTNPLGMIVKYKGRWCASQELKF